MRQMPLAIAEKVLERYHDQKIEWFNWGEPLYYKQLYELSEMAKYTNSRISSSLSLGITDKTVSAIKNFKSIIISISGLDVNTYNIYHQGGDFELVKYNLHVLATSGCNILLRWLSHKYNYHQYAAAKSFCEQRDIQFQPTELNCTVEDGLGGFKNELIKTTSSKRKECKQLKWAPIDVDGNYLLCCASQNVKIGLTINDDISIRELIEAKKNMPLCKKCREQKIWKMF